LHEALELATRCQSDLIADRATTELSAAGARPRRPMRSGIDALTPSELRIATMAADGLSNPQIAQSLFVTRKTVEAHLAHAYQKLSVNSRTQLRHALHPTSTQHDTQFPSDEAQCNCSGTTGGRSATRSRQPE
jgi:DNA-binding NarL/FixJ family response regulator